MPRTRSRAARRRRLLRRTGIVAGVVLLAALVFTAWQAMTVRSSLLAVADELTGMRDAVAAGDADAAGARLDAADEAAVAAYRNSRGPFWWAGTKLPMLGDDVTAVRTVAEVSRNLTQDGLPELAAAGNEVSANAFAPRDGGVSLEPIAALAPALDTGYLVVSDSATRVNRLDTDGLLTPVRGPVEDLRAKLNDASDVLRDAATVAELMPAMLGTDGPRRYLLLFQNNAEIRAGGGLGGAMAVLAADDGALEMVGQTTPAKLGVFDPPLRGLTSEERTLFTDRLGTYPADVSMTPHYPRTGELLAAMWRRTSGQDVDGVVSVDPVALSYLLRATGPVEVPPIGSIPATTLTADNVVDRLLRDTYLDVADLELQNDYFALVARTVFQSFIAAPGDPAALVKALEQGVSERRLLVWSARAEEQQVLEPLAIAGAVPDAVTPRPEIGFYLNDSGSDKLTYYLDQRLTVRPRSCGSNGNQVLDVTVKLSSSVPEGKLPPSVVGPGTPGVRLGTMLLTSYLYAPVGGRVDAVSLDGDDLDVSIATHRGRDVGLLTLTLDRGETRTLRYAVLTGRNQTGEPRVLTTPLVRGTGIAKVGDSAC